MSLPKIEHPIHDVQLSIGKVQFRPFLVKEQKILLMAHQSEKIESIVDAIKQIFQNCIVTPGIDVDSMPLSDLIHLFINIRARSMGETMRVYFKCTNEVEGKACGMVLDGEINLLEIVPEGGGGTGKIMITKDIGIQMHYPSFDLLHLISKSDSIDSEFLVVAGCIEYVFDSNSIYKAAEASPQEILKFVEDLPEDKYNLLKQYIASAPTVKKTLKKKCVRCEYEHDLVLEGLSDFFV